MKAAVATLGSIWPTCRPVAIEATSMPWATRWPKTERSAATLSVWNQLKSPDRPQKFTTSVSVIVRPADSATSPSVRSSHKRRSSATCGPPYSPVSAGEGLEALHPLADPLQPLLQHVVRASVREPDVA